MYTLSDPATSRDERRNALYPWYSSFFTDKLFFPMTRCWQLFPIYLHLKLHKNANNVNFGSFEKARSIYISSRTGTQWIKFSCGNWIREGSGQGADLARIVEGELQDVTGEVCRGRLFFFQKRSLWCKASVEVKETFVSNLSVLLRSVKGVKQTPFYP